MKDLQLKYEPETGMYAIINWSWNRTHKWNEWRRPTMEMALDLIEELEKI